MAAQGGLQSPQSPTKPQASASLTGCLSWKQPCMPTKTWGNGFCRGGNCQKKHADQQNLPLFGLIWSCFASFGLIWPHVAHPDLICQLPLNQKHNNFKHQMQLTIINITKPHCYSTLTGLCLHRSFNCIKALFPSLKSKPVIDMQLRKHFTCCSQQTMLQARCPELANSNCFYTIFFETCFFWQDSSAQNCFELTSAWAVSLQHKTCKDYRNLHTYSMRSTSSSINLWYMSNTWTLIVVFAPSFSQLAALCCGHQLWQPLCSRCMLMHCMGCKSTSCGTSCRVA